MENAPKQRGTQPRISRRTALEPSLAQDAGSWCVAHHVRRKTFLSVAIRLAMEDPEALAEMRRVDAGLSEQRRQVRLGRQATYRGNSLL